MRRILFAFLLILACAASAYGQSTVTSGTILDANGQAFAGGTYNITFNPNGHVQPFQWNGSQFTPQTYAGALDNTGSFSGISIPSTNAISPSGTLWRVTVCPLASSPCYSTNVALQGASLNIGSQITPPAIKVSASDYNQPTAYSDGEINGAKVGFLYFNLTDQTIHECTVSVPCSWVALAPGTPNTVKVDGVPVPNPNFQDSSSNAYSVSGSNIELLPQYMEVGPVGIANGNFVAPSFYPTCLTDIPSCVPPNPPQGWSLDANTTLSYDQTTAPPNNEFSIKLTCITSGMECGMNNMVLQSLTPGQTYLATAYVRGDGTVGTQLAWEFQRSADPAGDLACFSPPVTSTTWTFVTVSCTAGNQDNGFVFITMNNDESSTAGSMWVQDVQVWSVTQPQIVTANLNNILHVGAGNTQWGSGDIGSQINAAYAALPAIGGKIIVDPQTTGGCYSYTTPIVLATANKWPILEGSGSTGIAATGSCLNYTPTSGAAITLDYAIVGSNEPPIQQGLRSIKFINNGCVTTGGCGGTAVGIQIGNTNAGNLESLMREVSVEGFATGYSNSNNTAPNTTWTDCTFYSNAVALKYNATNAETFKGGTFAGNGQLLVNGATYGGELYFTNVITFVNNSAGAAFDYSALSPTGTPANLSLVSTHVESDNSASGAHFVIGTVNFSMQQGELEDDSSSGTGDWMIHQAAGFLDVDTTVTSDRAYTQLVLADSNVRGTMRAELLSTPIQAVPLAGGANAKYITQIPIVESPTSNAARVWTVESPQLFLGGVTPGVTTVSALPSASANVGLIRQVSDSTTVSAEGQTCVGSSTNTALAFSNGSVWKCF
jgi:hypothetical protein